MKRDEGLCLVSQLIFIPGSCSWLIASQTAGLKKQMKVRAEVHGGD
jgi:hypothetical protein